MLEGDLPMEWLRRRSTRQVGVVVRHPDAGAAGRSAGGQTTTTAAELGGKSQSWTLSRLLPTANGGGSYPPPSPAHRGEHLNLENSNRSKAFFDPF